MENRFAGLHKPSDISCSILIKAYGNTGQPDKATEFLQRAMSNPDLPLSVRCLTFVVESWAKSTRPDAVERATDVISLFEREPKCQREGLKPLRYTYAALIKCIAEKKPMTLSIEWRESYKKSSWIMRLLVWLSEYVWRLETVNGRPRFCNEIRNRNSLRR